MKTLTEILSEKLHINKKLRSNNILEIPIPYVESGDYVVEDPNNIWKTLEIPANNYIICKDKYRHDLIMFTTLTNLLESILQLEDDYEDWDINNDVLYSSDDLEETIDWYAKYLGIDNLRNDKSLEIDDLRECIGYKKLMKTKNCKDSYHFLAELIHGDITEQSLKDNDVHNTLAGCAFDLNKYDAKDFPDWAHKHIK